jgi:hypothetical protein
VDSVSRRAYLEQMAENATSEQARLKALELLEKLDEREGGNRPTAKEPEVPDIEKLSMLTDLLIEHGALNEFPAFREQVERRAEELIEERAQEAREAMRRDSAGRPADEPSAPEGEDDPPEASEAVSEPESAPEVHPEDKPKRLDPHAPEILRRQWPSGRPGGGLRDVTTTVRLGALLDD